MPPDLSLPTSLVFIVCLYLRWEWVSGWLVCVGAWVELTDDVVE